jgi:hypothetical protein
LAHQTQQLQVAFNELRLSGLSLAPACIVYAHAKTITADELSYSIPHFHNVAHTETPLIAAPMTD